MFQVSIIVSESWLVNEFCEAEKGGLDICMGMIIFWQPN